MIFARADDPRERLPEENGSSFGMAFVVFPFMTLHMGPFDGFRKLRHAVAAQVSV
ncbi:hypothetical protein [Nitrobacter sp. 62-13]|uniref:hypothetical protein n=1 Tax=Nitrobacter sp. 62-13 TaxID=1895797 RepID=UPI002600208E|nr:hypothetical protein [Nitrobacter sp. 62-13]